MVSVINYAAGESLPAMIRAKPDQSFTSFALVNTKDKNPLSN